MSRHSAERGFTLIELLIVVVVIGILAAVAIPSYRNYVMKSRRADGQAALLALAMAQEKFRVNCPYYAQSLAAADTCGASAAASSINFSSTSTDGYYTLAMVANSASPVAFSAQATPTSKGGQATADNLCTGANFQLTQNGPDKSTADKKTCWGAQ